MIIRSISEFHNLMPIRITLTFIQATIKATGFRGRRKFFNVTLHLDVYEPISFELIIMIIAIYELYTLMPVSVSLVFIPWSHGYGEMFTLSYQFEVMGLVGTVFINTDD